MSDTTVVIIESPFGVLAFSRDEIVQAIERAKALIPATVAMNETVMPERLLTTEEMETATSVPASWFAEAARRGDIPHYRLGRYPRYRLSEILASGAIRVRA